MLHQSLLENFLDTLAKHDNHKKIDRQSEINVIELIKSNKVVASHYVRKMEKNYFLPK